VVVTDVGSYVSLQFNLPFSHQVTNIKIHGDLNISNFYYMEEEGLLSVIDWDQVQVDWYMMDLAQAEFAIYKLYGGNCNGESK
jgi:Ser/Thr protein kinase RdoA (MazF antagonist)